MSEYNPKSNVTFGSVNLSTYNAFAIYCNIFDRPERDVEVVSVPGRNGDLIFDNGRYKNLDRVYTIQVTGVANAQNLINALTKAIGYQELEDDYDTTVYYMARLKNRPRVVQFVGNAVLLTVTFDRKPQRWLKSGRDTAITGTYIGTVNYYSTLAPVIEIVIDNVSEDDVLPRIYIPGKQPQYTWTVWAHQEDEDLSGEQNLNGKFHSENKLFEVYKVMTYEDATSFIEVDSESRTITHGNGYNTDPYKDQYRTEIYKYAKLKPGLNYLYFTFTYDGTHIVYPTPANLKSPKVYPRWWTI